jgi:hypothetical protein
MKKVLLGIAGVVGLGVVGMVGGASMQEDHTHLERKITVAASAEDIKYFAEDLKGFNEWSPWSELDPDMEQKYSDPSGGVGATYEWKGNDDVGHGIMTVKSSTDGKVEHDLKFIEPFEAKSLATITWQAKGEELEVTWAFDQDNSFGSKMAMMFMDMEGMLGADYEKGLSQLKPVVEKAAAAREAEAKVKAEAAAKAKAEAEEKARAEAKAKADAAMASGQPPTPE